MALADGFHDVPPGKVATIVTHLEMLSPPPAGPAAVLPDGIEMVRVSQPGIAWYRDLFFEVGGRDWLWVSRLALSEPALAAILNDPRVMIWTLRGPSGDLALLELDFREDGECELAFFGLTRALIGQGAGRWLMQYAIREAWSHPIHRFHVHTCTLDSPQSLGFYQRSGFVPVRQQVELFDDPRSGGLLPLEAAPHIPRFPPD